MHKEFRDLWSGSTSRSLVFDGKQHKVLSSELYATPDDPHGVLLRFKWQLEEGVKGTVTLRKGDIEAGGFNPDTQTFEFIDAADRLRALQLVNNGSVMLPSDTTARQARKGFEPTVLSELRRLWTKTLKGRFVLDDSGARHEITSSEFELDNGAAGHVVLHLRWFVGQSRRFVALTESDVLAGRYDEERNAFVFVDRTGKSVGIQIQADGQFLVPEGLPTPESKAEPMVFVVAQEGGSTGELYLHSFDSEADASTYKLDAWASGAYRTAPTVKVPASLADHPAFFKVAEQLAKTALTLDGVGE